MDITIHPGTLHGEIHVIPSKSIAHRYLICAAFADKETTLVCPETNRDIEATADCLCALGAKIIRTESGYNVFPIGELPKQAVMNCGESGSTLRFLLPIVGALGVDCTFLIEGRLPQRPLSPLWEEMERMGCTLSRPTETTLRCQGKLKNGSYTIAGDVSSQFITGLLFAHCLMGWQSTLDITGKVESKPYIDMSLDAIQLFQGDRGSLRSPGIISVEGDWSNGAFFLAADILGSNHLNVYSLNEQSSQGDKTVVGILPMLQNCKPIISAADIPDLVPILSVVAAANHGAVFTDVQRLRMKESDRVASVIAMIEALGGKAEQTKNTLTIHGTGLTGGTVDACRDHRIAMSAAIAATVCKEPVTIRGAECVSKSYPSFWEEYKRLGGHYEQHLR